MAESGIELASKKEGNRFLSEVENENEGKEGRELQGNYYNNRKRRNFTGLV